MVLSEGHGLPVSVHIASDSPHEVTLIEPLLSFRRLVTRYEYHADLFLGCVNMACMIIVLRQF